MDGLEVKRRFLLSLRNAFGDEFPMISAIAVRLAATPELVPQSRGDPGEVRCRRPLARPLSSGDALSCGRSVRAKMRGARFGPLGRETLYSLVFQDIGCSRIYQGRNCRTTIKLDPVSNLSVIS